MEGAGKGSEARASAGSSGRSQVLDAETDTRRDGESDKLGAKPIHQRASSVGLDARWKLTAPTPSILPIGGGWGRGVVFV